MAHYGNRQVLLGAASGSASTNTSAPWFVGDFRLVSLSFASSATAGASRFTIEGSNADGLQATDLGSSTQTLNWSLVSGVNMVGAAPGMITLDPPGYRWLRTHVTPFSTFSNLASVTSNTTIMGWGVRF